MTEEAIPFDIHRYVQNLVASGFTEKQAEALAYEQVNLLNSNLATKADIESIRAEVEALRLSIESKIEALRLSTEGKVESAKFEMVKWMIGAMVAQSTLIVVLTVALVKLL